MPQIVIKGAYTPNFQTKQINCHLILRDLMINLPRTASTEIKMSARCCHRIAIEGVRSVAGKVINATALETRSKLFSDCKNLSISQSWYIHQIQMQSFKIPMEGSTNFEGT
jgi:hypothetical protein